MQKQLQHEERVNMESLVNVTEIKIAHQSKLGLSCLIPENWSITDNIDEDGGCI